MAITAVELENFRAFSERQRLEVRPLTLLFGANNAGKSSLLQVFGFVGDLLEGRASAERALARSRRLVHGHRADAKIRLCIEFEVLGTLDPEGTAAEDFPFPDLDDEVTAAWCELVVGEGSSADRRQHERRVESCEIGINRDPEPILWLHLDDAGRRDSPIQCRVNLVHTGFGGVDSAVLESWERVATPESSNSDEDVRPENAPREVWLPVFEVVRGAAGALPDLDRPIALTVGSGAGRDATDILHIRYLLQLLVHGILGHLRRQLSQEIHVGPLRKVPTMAQLAGIADGELGWYDGLAAWKHLLEAPTSVLSDTNEWLKQINAGCKIVEQVLTDPSAPEDADLSDPAWGGRRLLLDAGGTRVLPSEVGSGIAQLVPVVVAAVLRHRVLVVMEQPELHVHPALQVGLGDLLIDAIESSRARRSLIVETHSEHLILRVLKRIRQTTEGELPKGSQGFSRDKLRVVYIDSSDGVARIKHLDVSEDGEFVDRWPRGFFAERMEELL